MASGEKHARATVVMVLPTALTTFYFTNDISMGMVAGIGCLAGLFIEPDLDVNGLTRSEWSLLRTAWPIGLLWFVLWYPYGFIVPHRSAFSHRPIIGTFGRLIYLFTIVLIALVLFEQTSLLTWLWSRVSSLHTLAFIGGLALSDLFHWLMDGCP